MVTLVDGVTGDGDLGGTVDDVTVGDGIVAGEAPDAPATPVTTRTATALAASAVRTGRDDRFMRQNPSVLR